MSEIKFGERIRAIRKGVGVNQKRFCSMLDMPQSTLSAYENDDVPMPDESSADDYPF